MVRSGGIPVAWNDKIPNVSHCVLIGPGNKWWGTSHYLMANGSWQCKTAKKHEAVTWCEEMFQHHISLSWKKSQNVLNKALYPVASVVEEEWFIYGVKWEVIQQFLGNMMPWNLSLVSFSTTCGLKRITDTYNGSLSHKMMGVREREAFLSISSS